MKLNAELEIAGITVTRKNSGQTQGPISMYFRLLGDVSVDALEEMFPTRQSFIDEIDGRWDEVEELKHSLVNELRLELKGVGVRFEIKPEFGRPAVFATSEVDRVKIRLKSGRRVDLSLRVQVTPADDQIAQVIGWLGNVLKCEIWSRQGELPLDQAQSGAEPKTDAAPAKPKAKVSQAPLPVEASAEGAIVPGQKPPQRAKRHRPEVH